MRKYIVSFPHMGNYYSPIYNLLRNILPDCEIMIPNKITQKTLEVGTVQSPDFVCTPFKYNLGNFIESLESGANVLIQAGGGCRFGYYAEVQEEILKKLGYNFHFIKLLDAKKLDIRKVFLKFKNLNPDLKFSSFAYYFLLTFKIVNFLDDFEMKLRENMALCDNLNALEKLHNDLLNEIKTILSFKDFKNIKKHYTKLLEARISNKNTIEEKNILKVGIVGELYTSMEPFSSFFIEQELGKMGVMVKRYTTVTYLLFEKGKSEKGLLDYASNYIEYALGADGTESVAHSKYLCENGYDGIIHTKPFGCTPEMNAMPILQRISQDYNVPIIYFTFDEQTSQTGVKTRLEAFYDMIKMKKETKLLG